MIFFKVDMACSMHIFFKTFKKVKMRIFSDDTRDDGKQNIKSLWPNKCVVQYLDSVKPVALIDNYYRHGWTVLILFTETKEATYADTETTRFPDLGYWSHLHYVSSRLALIRLTLITNQTGLYRADISSKKRSSVDFKLSIYNTSDSHPESCACALHVHA